MKNKISSVDSHYTVGYSFVKDGKIFKRGPWPVNLQMSVFLLGAIPLLQFIFMLQDNYTPLLWLVCIPAIIVLFIDLFRVYKKGRIHYIFDRINGELIFPESYFRSERKVYRFSNIFIDFRKKCVYEKRDDSQHYLIYALIPEISEKSFVDDWSFYIWYMDKNRPFPPGEAFRKYRQEDFERRKTEGFLKPLYPSIIKTPEATKEQQTEREHIGGW